MGAVVKLDRLEKIYKTRDLALEKLATVGWSYAYPVSARYYNDSGGICVLLALGTGDGTFEVVADSDGLSTDTGNGSIYTFTRLSYSVSDDLSIESSLSGETPKAGDISIITTQIGGQVRDKVAFVYNSDLGRWEALIGAVDATKVILRDDIELYGDYDSFGNIKKSQGTWKVSGKSVWEALNEALDTTIDPEISKEPGLSLVASVSGTREVGSIITQGYTLGVTDGKYSCAGVDQSIGAYIESATVKLGDRENTNFPKGSFGEITLGPGYSEIITAQVQVRTDTKALNNKGLETDLIWGPKTYSLSSGRLVSFRNGIWYGGLSEIPESWESSDSLGNLLREKLGKTGKTYGAGTISTTIKTGSVVFVIAWEKGKGSLSRVFDATGNEDISLSNFTEHTIIIPGASGGIDSEYATTYTLYEYAPVSGEWLKDLSIQLIFT
jgi:hypothetical protein